ncbi:MAG: diguanylate cyclase [Burkholderiales bacterium]
MKWSTRPVPNALRHGSPIVLDVPADVRYLLLQRYLEMSARTSRLTVVSFAVFLFGFAYQAPLWPRVAVLVGLTAAMVLRAVLAKRVQQRMDSADPTSDRLHDALVVATPLAWSAAPYLLQPYIAEPNLYGILYGALIPLTVTCIGYIAALPICILAVACGAVPLVVFMLLQHGVVPSVMALATTMCITTLLARAAHGHGTLLRALVAERKNALLVRELEGFRKALETENATLDSSLRDAAWAATRDPLTGLFNRRHLDGVVQPLAELVRGGQEEVTLCMIDVDHFKQVNDAHGHRVGDEVLRAVGGLLEARLREGDCLARIGGEEFLAVLRNCDLNRGRRVAESLRHNVAASRIATEAGEVPVTVSLGVSQWTADEHFDTVVERADRALYDAKHGGRDRVEFHAIEAAAAPELLLPGRLH